MSLKVETQWRGRPHHCRLGSSVVKIEIELGLSDRDYTTEEYTSSSSSPGTTFRPPPQILAAY